MRGFLFLLTMAATLAQSVPAPPGARQGTTVQSGVPLRVALERRVIIKHVGEPIRGRLVEPIYVFDRMILPAGSLVEGHVAQIGGVPFGRRLQALLYGNLTPPRDIHAQFDTLVLTDGSRISLHTAPARGTPHTARVAKPGKKGFFPLQSARDRMQSGRAAFLAFKEPGKWSRLKYRLFEMLPYHRQAWPAGTLFTGVLQEPLSGLTPAPVEARVEDPAAAEAEAQEVTARLLAPISSKTAQRGAPVEAVVTRPVFSRQSCAADSGRQPPPGRRGGSAPGAFLSPQRESAVCFPRDQAAGGGSARRSGLCGGGGSGFRCAPGPRLGRGRTSTAPRPGSFSRPSRPPRLACRFIRITMPRAFPIGTSEGAPNPGPWVSG